MNEQQDVSVTDLPISGRAIKALARGGIRTVETLVAHDAWELCDIRGFGPECLRETVDALAEIGLTLKPSNFSDRKLTS
jgi:DNA-directed RNA polymerase alpha subunit